MSGERAFGRRVRGREIAEGPEGARHRFAGKPPAAAASDGQDVDTIVHEFLEELDTLSTTVRPDSGTTPEQAGRAAGAQTSREWPPHEVASAQAPAAPDIRADEPLCEDVDAEIDRTLAELESRPKLKVIPLASREVSRPPAPEAAPTPQETSVPPAVAPAAKEPPVEEAERRSRDRLAPAAASVPPEPARPAIGVGTPAVSSAESARSARVWRLAAAAIILVAMLTVASYYYFKSRSALPGNPPASIAAASPPAADAGSSGSPATTPGVQSAPPPFLSPAPQSARGDTASRTETRPAAAKPSPQAAARDASRKPAPPAAPPGNNAADAAPAKTDAAVVEPPPRPAAQAAGELPVVNPVTSAPPNQPAGAQVKPAGEPPPTAAKGDTAAPPPSELTKLPAQRPAADPAAAATSPAETTNKPIPAADSPAPPTPLATPPVALSRVMPAFPPAARRMQAEGRVDLVVQVDAQGKVVKATATSGPPVLRPAAEDALMRWRFKPATLRGVNVPSEVSVSIDFKR